MSINIAERDRCIAVDYVEDNKEVHELARINGLSVRRVQQILDKAGVTRRKTTKRGVVSPDAERIGLALYNYRFDRGFDPYTAAQALGWSIIRLRKIEQGTTDPTLTELLDIAAFTKTPLSQLLKEKHASSSS